MAYVIQLICVCLCVSLVSCQFGFFSQRDDRRYESPFQSGFNKLLSSPKRITERLTGILHLRPEDHNTNPSYVYPFRRPGITTENQNYGNSNQGGYGYEGQGYNNNQGYQNYGYNENNGNPVVFPTSNPDGTAVNFVNNDNGQYTESNPSNNGGSAVNDGTAVNFVNNNNGVYTESNPPNNNNGGTAVNFVNNNGEYTESNPFSNNNGGSAVNFVNNDGQYTESNPPTFGTAINFVNNANGQYIESKPSNNNQEETDQNSNDEDKQQGKESSDPETENGNGSLVQGITNGSPFSNNNGIPSTPQAGFPEVPPAAIPNVPSSDVPDVPSGITNGPSAFGQTELPMLTPVPDAEKRNNFNFGPAGLFKETCVTIDQETGVCISILECQPYLSVLKDTRTNPQAVQILRKAHCGFEGNNPKVCCPLPGFPTLPPTAPPTTTTTTTAAPQNPDDTNPTILEPSDRLGAFLEPPVCGFSNASFSRVVGGVPAKLGDFPWMALLGYKRGTATRWLCGGSLISAKHVLTAAHCINGHEADLYLVRLGELDLEREDEGATPVDVLIKYKIKHAEYSPTAFTNDIGILVLDKEMSFTDLIRPICIPKDSELRARSFENYTPIIAGWGDTEFRGPSASHLQALQLPVVSNDFCAKAYVNYKNQHIDDRVLCAGYKQGGKDACQGDSGGPLMQPIWNNQDYTTHFYQIGVVSFGRKCAEVGFPGVYTRVTHFVPWLEQQIIGA